MATKLYLCNGCNQTSQLDELDDKDRCPYCGSYELELIAEPLPLPSKGDEDEWSGEGYWYGT